MMIVPEAANRPPTPWQTEIPALGIWAGAMPRIWRTLFCNAYMPHMPERIRRHWKAPASPCGTKSTVR